MQTAAITRFTPKWPLAVTPKICHLFEQSRKECEDRQGTVVEMTAENPFPTGQSMFAEGVTSSTRSPKAAEHALLQTSGEKNTSCIMCHDRGPTSWDSRPFCPHSLITGKGTSSNSEPLWDYPISQPKSRCTDTAGSHTDRHMRTWDRQKMHRNADNTKGE